MGNRPSLILVGERGEVKAKTNTINNVIACGRFHYPNCLLIDIEGVELKVFIGANQSIQKFRPKISMAVYHTSTQAQEILEYCYSHFTQYAWRFRGMYTWGDCEPRPYMLYGWPRK